MGQRNGIVHGTGSSPATAFHVEAGQRGAVVAVWTALRAMSPELRNPAVLVHYVQKQTVALQEEVVKRHQVYCLCPDVNNIIMRGQKGHIILVMKPSIANGLPPRYCLKGKGI